MSDRAVDDLIRECLAAGDPDTWAYSAAIEALRARGDRTVLDAALGLLRGPDPLGRALAAEILSDLGGLEHPFGDEAVPALIRALDDPDPVVRRHAASALSHQEDPRAVGPLATRRDDPDPEVRYAVAVALAHQDDPAAVDALVALTRDARPAVRDWATFALGSLAPASTPAVIGALVERLADEDDQTREEAVAGLVRRSAESGVVEALAAALAAGQVCRGTLEAAARLADPRLLPTLLAAHASSDAEALLLEHAILACSPEEEPEPGA